MHSPQCATAQIERTAALIEPHLESAKSEFLRTPRTRKPATLIVLAFHLNDPHTIDLGRCKSHVTVTLGIGMMNFPPRFR